MDKEKTIKATVALYEITKVFPEKEPLKNQVRERANDVLISAIAFTFEKSQKNPIFWQIEQLLALFEVAKTQKWVNEKNFLVLEGYYKGLKKELIQELSQKQAPKVINLPPREKILSPQESPKTEQSIFEKTKKWGIEQKSQDSQENSSGFPQERQAQIVEMIKKRKIVSLEQVQNSFPEITSRTIRRDMRLLMAKDILERKRESKKDVFFFLKNKK